MKKIKTRLFTKHDTVLNQNLKSLEDRIRKLSTRTTKGLTTIARTVDKHAENFNTIAVSIRMLQDSCHTLSNRVDRLEREVKNDGKKKRKTSYKKH